MSVLHNAADLVLHLDRHLIELLMRYDVWIYGILFAIIFAETGLVVTPFLPGDSLLFGVGALAAVDRSGSLSIGWAFVLLAAAAVAGNSVNYAIGRMLGQRAFSGRYRFFKLAYLQRTEGYFRRHGGLTVLLSRFTPISAHLCAVRRRHRPHAVPALPGLQHCRRRIVGGVVPVRRLCFRQPAAGQEQFRRRDAAGDRRIAGAAAGGGAARARHCRRA